MVEASRRIIRIAHESSRRIAAYVQSGNSVNAKAIRQIILRVARRWFPSLPAPVSGGNSGIGGNTNISQNQGTWVRQGNRIILQGA